jgi:hypothetical protein
MRSPTRLPHFRAYLRCEGKFPFLAPLEAEVVILRLRHLRPKDLVPRVLAEVQRTFLSPSFRAEGGISLTESIQQGSEIALQQKQRGPDRSGPLANLNSIDSVLR